MLRWIASHVPVKLPPVHDGHRPQSIRHPSPQKTRAGLVESSGQTAPPRSSPSHSSLPPRTPLPHEEGSVVVDPVVVVFVLPVVVVPVTVVVVEGETILHSTHVTPSLGSHSSPAPGSRLPSPHWPGNARTLVGGRPLARSVPFSSLHPVIVPTKRGLVRLPQAVFHLARTRQPVCVAFIETDDALQLAPSVIVLPLKTITPASVPAVSGRRFAIASTMKRPSHGGCFAFFARAGEATTRTAHTTLDKQRARISGPRVQGMRGPPSATPVTRIRGVCLQGTCPPAGLGHRPALPPAHADRSRHARPASAGGR